MALIASHGLSMPTVRKTLSSSPHILLVDDNPHGNVARKAVLEEQGYSVACAPDGKEALLAFENEPFDLVVTDLKMERMNGLELIAHLRASGKPVRIILLSAWAVCLGLTEETSGADAVLCKSNKEQDELSRTIRQLLSRSAQLAKKPAAKQKAERSSVARSG